MGGPESHLVLYVHVNAFMRFDSRAIWIVKVIMKEPPAAQVTLLPSSWDASVREVRVEVRFPPLKSVTDTWNTISPSPTGGNV